MTTFLRRRLALAAVLVTAAGGGGGYFALRAAQPDPPAADVPADDPDLAKSVADARAAVEKDPKSADAWGKLGLVFAAHVYADESLVCFEQAERLAPADRRWPYHQGLVLYARDPAAAVPKFRRSLELGKSEAARLRLAEALVALGRFAEAEPEFEELLKTVPDHARAKLGLARIALDRGDLTACETHLAVDDPLTRKSAAAVRAELKHRQGDPAAAALAQQKAAELPADPAWPDPDVEAIAKLRTGLAVRSQLANQLADAGRYDEAERALRSILAARPDSAKHQLLLGYVLIQKRDFAGAEKTMADAARDQPDCPRAHLYLGIARFNRGDPARAAEAFARAAELKPDYTAAHANLAQCRKQAGDRGGAVAAYRAAVATAPQNADLHVALAEALIADGKPAEAAAALAEALAVNPGHAKAKELKAGLK